MLLVDVNILLYAKVSTYPQHVAASDWLETQINANTRLGLSWSTILGFLRIITNPRVYRTPLTTEEALSQIEEWLSLPNIWIPEPTIQHQTILSQLLRSGQLTGNLIPDAHLAVLAIEHGLEVCSTDSDFARFAKCKWKNPLTPLDPSPVL